MAGIEIRKKEGETAGSMLFRFTKRIRQSGVLMEVRKRRFRKRAVNRRKRRISAQYRAAKKVEVARQRRLGIL